MEGRQKVLSERLQAIANMVTPGRVMADVGCDHGFVSIYLVQKEICPRVIAMDVRKGPLEGAVEHVAQAGLEGRIELRLSDGITELEPGEASGVIIAGMGGRLMQQILDKEPEKTASFQEMILQPQSELKQFRQFLRKKGWVSVEEKIILEDGKYYFPMKVIKAKDWETNKLPEIQELEDTFGPLLLKEKSALFIEYLNWELHTYQGVLENLRKNSSEARARMEEVEMEIAKIKKAISY